MSREGRDLKFLGLVFGVALTLRLIPVLLTRDLGIALDDMFQYDALAESIRLGRGYTWYGGIPTAARAPAYPLFLAGVYSAFGHRFVAARTAQAVIASFVPVVVYALGIRLFDRPVARTGSLLMAFYPIFLVYPLALVTENLFFLLVPLVILCLLEAVATSRTRYYVLAGLVLGVCILTRSVLAGFVLLILPWVWRSSAGTRHAVKNSAAIIAAVAILTVPWSIRNSALYRQFVFVESSLGFNFYLGYHPEGTGTFDSAIAVDFLEEVGAFDKPDLETEMQVHNLGMEKGLQFVRQNPGRAAWLALSKLSHFLRLDKRAPLYFYSNNFLGEVAPPVLLFALLVICLPWVVVLLLAVMGMSFSTVARETVLIYLLSAYLVGVHMLIMAEPRFHLVLVPFLAVFAAHGGRELARVKDKLRASDATVRRSTRWRMGLSLLVVALLVLNWAYELSVDMDKLRVLFSAGGNLARFTY
jgi:4-amino-4-deoxy-L-arabinose transferase-like glycosyltransferase